MEINEVNKKTLSMLLEQLGKTISERQQWLEEHILVYNATGDNGEKDPNVYDEEGNIISSEEDVEPQEERRLLNFDTFDKFIQKINEENNEENEGDSDEVDLSMIDGLDRAIKRKWEK